MHDRGGCHHEAGSCVGSFRYFQRSDDDPEPDRRAGADPLVVYEPAKDGKEEKAGGIGDEDIKKAIQCGIAKINIHTELCQAAMEAINEHKDEPFLAVERAVRQAVKERAMYKIKLFGDDGRADE